MCTYTCMCMCIYTHIYIYMYICMCIYIDMYMCIYIYIHTHAYLYYIYTHVYLVGWGNLASRGPGAAALRLCAVGGRRGADPNTKMNVVVKYVATTIYDIIIDIILVRYVICVINRVSSCLSYYRYYYCS